MDCTALLTDQLRSAVLCKPAQGVEPVLRTYNTLIIACNMCNQPREAMAVHKRMLDEGYTPNATTYNALISAHGKAGQLDKVGPEPTLLIAWLMPIMPAPAHA